MTRARTITEHLIEEGKAARAHFQVWWALRNMALPDYLDAMNDLEYVDFFHASNSGHYKLFFITLAKIFDRDDRVAGVKELRKALRAQGRSDLALIIAKELKPITPLVQRILRIRNMRIAHNDLTTPIDKVYRVNGITPNQIRRVIDETCEIINQVAGELGISNRIFEGGRLEQATLRMLETLRQGKA